MEVDFSRWKTAYLEAVTRAFGSRIVCAGVQGSRARGEAREGSDIDTVLILDELTATDLDAYRALIQHLPNSDLACGFVSGREALLHWDAGELVNFYFDTLCLLGDLEFLRPRLTREAARRSVHQAASGLYHALCHASVFEAEQLDACAFAKGLFFLLRAKYFAEGGAFPIRLIDLMPLVNGEERALLLPLTCETYPALNRDAALALLTQWIERFGDRSAVHSADGTI